MGPCSPAERGVSEEREIMDKGPSPALVEASAGWWGQGSRDPPRGKLQLNPPCWLVTAPAPRQEGTRAEGRARIPPEPGQAPPHAWHHPTLPPSQGTPWGHRSPSHHSSQWAHTGKDSWARGWQMPGEGRSSGTHLDILCRGALGASWKGSTGSQMERSHSDHLRGLDIFGK